MTARQVFEGMLTELNKVNAPSLLLQDFNYFFNKAINLYINKRYNIYDISLQTSDDLRVLKATSALDVTKSENGFLKDLTNLTAGNSKLLGATYEVDLPSDYLHILNCICVYELSKDFKCYNKGDNVPFAAKRLTADSFSVILNDYYQRPLPERPYYYIHNINSKNTLPTNEITSKGGTDSFKKYGFEGNISTIYKYNNSEVFVKNGKIYSNKECTEELPESVLGILKVSDLTTITTQIPSREDNTNFPRSINLQSLQGINREISTVEKEAALRYGNSSKVRMEIRYGHDDSIFKLKKVLVDYIKTPQHIRLTQELMNLTEDTSQIMEFPDYVCQEIINELTMLVMENTSNPRLLTNPLVSQSIVNPAQQLTQPQSRQKSDRD